MLGIPDPNINDMRYFREVAKTQNITRGAERVGITQPAMTAAINRLETSAGVKLINRTKSGVALTKAGEMFLKRSEVILGEVDALRDIGKKSKLEPVGHYKIGCHPSIALISIPEGVGTLYSKFKDLEISMVHDLSRNINEAILGGAVDFGIVVNPTPHPGLVIKQLTEDKVCFWKHPDLPLESSKTVIYNPALQQSQHLLKCVAKEKVVEFERQIESSHLELLAEMAKNKIGIAILPGSVARRYERVGDLMKVNPDWPFFLDKISFVYRQDMQERQIAKLLGEHIKAGISYHMD